MKNKNFVGSKCSKNVNKFAYFVSKLWINI